MPAPANLDARGLPIGYPFKPEWEVTPREVKGLLASPPDGLILLDCRNADERQIAKIDAAVHIPMGDIERRFDELETDDGARTAPIIVHCHHGVRSMKVTGMLRALGFADVRSMAGGIDLWAADIDPRVPRY